MSSSPTRRWSRLARREGVGPESLGSFLGSFLSGGFGGRLSANQRAAAIWYRANGDTERRHTTGVFLRRARSAALPPVLGVYVDSSTRLTDFSASRDVYLARLANAGLELSGIEFRLTRSPRPVCGQVGAGREEPSAAPELPPLSAADMARIDELASGLPDGLRQDASRAMELSLRREVLRARESKSRGEK